MVNQKSLADLWLENAPVIIRLATPIPVPFPGLAQEFSQYQKNPESIQRMLRKLRMNRIFIALITSCLLTSSCLFFVRADAAFGAVLTNELAETATFKKLFPTPTTIKKQVRFWEKVFYKYSSSTVVVHEADALDRIVDVIDYKHYGKSENKAPIARKEREEVNQRYLKRYNKALERFAKEKQLAVRHGAIEKRVFNVYQRDPKALKKLYEGTIKLRVQTGLADDFRLAAGHAVNYLPYMEKIFEQYGVPKQLSRLAFVESMFNIKARSKVGASGIWQFMPATARGYIFVNSIVDERNSPFKATKAAAQFLFENHRELKSWPLAVTAYNHGRLGMLNAVRQTASEDIGHIINNYESKSFGFASRNFYAEFVAAVQTFDRLRREGKIKSVPPLPDTLAMVLPTAYTTAEIIKYTPLTKELLEEHNPCILEPAFSPKKPKPLPEFYEIRVPRQLFQAVKSGLEGLNRTKYARR